MSQTNTSEAVQTAHHWERLIRQWAAARNLLQIEVLDRQYMKLVSEFGEVCEGHDERDMLKIKDGIGDTFVVMVILGAILGGNAAVEKCAAMKSTSSIVRFTSELGRLSDNVAKRQDSQTLERIGYLAESLHHIAAGYGLAFFDCVAHAYNEIKDRKGVMYGGTFVKSDDARYESIMKELGLPV